MSTGHPKSKRSSNLYIAAAVLFFIQTGILYGGMSLLGAGSTSNLLVFIAPIFGFVFLVGAFFARTGTGVVARTERHVGGGLYESRVETANAVTCGCMSGIGSLVLTGYGAFTFASQHGAIIYAAAIPGFLGSILAIITGLTALMGRSSPPSQAVSVPSRECPNCGKTGLSPAATACPNCGHPLE
jgi:hypothetical protein